MEFRHLGNKQYFPPIAPNGRVYAVPFEQETQVEVFCLTSVGIVGAGIQSLWPEIIGVHYDDQSWEIILCNYLRREMRFRRGFPCVMAVEGHETITTHIQGYAIPPCVMNRIAFEQTRGSEM